MPIYEEDPWRMQYFHAVECPPHVHVPTDDPDAYARNPRYRWVYNKLAVAESQGLACAPHGVEPASYPVFSKPIINLRGMGMGSCTLQSRAEYLQRQTPGHFWMTLLTGEHVSSDIAVINGEMVWVRTPSANPLPAGHLIIGPSIFDPDRCWSRIAVNGYGQISAATRACSILNRSVIA